jgi:GT2 family glycosyltransferase
VILEREAGTLVVLTGELGDGAHSALRRAHALARRWPGPVAIVALAGRVGAEAAAELSDRAQVIEARRVMGGALADGAPADAQSAAAVLLRMATGGSSLSRIYARLAPEEWPLLQAFADVAAGVPVDLEIGPEAGVPEVAPLWSAADALVVADMDRRYPLSAGSPALPVRVVPDGDGEEAIGALAELPLFGGAERVSVVIPVRGHAALAVRLVGSVIEHTAGLLEVILVDDASPARSLALLERLAIEDVRVRLLVNRAQRGFAASANRGLGAARGDVVVVLNADTVVTPDWSARLAAHRARPRCGAVGPLSNRAEWPQKLDGVTYDETTLSGLAPFAEALARGRSGQATPCVRLTGLCLMIPRPTLRRIGGFDPRFFPGGFEDDDWGVRLLSSGAVPYRADDVFLHHEGAASFALEPRDRAEIIEANWGRFKDKWGLPPERSQRDGWQPSEVCSAYDRARHFIAPWLAMEPVEAGDPLG